MSAIDNFILVFSTFTILVCIVFSIVNFRSLHLKQLPGHISEQMRNVPLKESQMFKWLLISSLVVIAVQFCRPFLEALEEVEKLQNLVFLLCIVAIEIAVFSFVLVMQLIVKIKKNEMKKMEHHD
jgi:hypothetical protein